MSTWYPASAPYPNAVAPPWRRPAGPAKALRILLVLTAVALAFEALAAIVRHAAYDDYLNGRGDDVSALDDADAFLGFATLAVGGLTIAVFVLTIVWQWRLAKNHQLLGRPDTAFGPGWAIGAWFIPLANLVLPFLQFRELWKGSEPGLTPNSYDWKRVTVPALLWLWWLTFVASYLVEWAFSFQFALDTETTFTDEPPLGGTLAADGLRIVASIAYLAVVGQLTRRQDQAVGEAQLRGPAPMAPSYPMAWTPTPGGAPPPPNVPAPGTTGWAPVPLAPPFDLTPGWKGDPTGRASYRYWDGSRWTENAATNGQAFTNPL